MTIIDFLNYLQEIKEPFIIALLFSELQICILLFNMNKKERKNVKHISQYLYLF